MAIRDTIPVYVVWLLVSGLTLRPAVAATASASFGVSATVQATCQASATARGVRIFADGTTNKASPVSVTCSNGAQYNVNLSAGTGFGANLALREMTGSSTALLGNALHLPLPSLVNRNQDARADRTTLTGNRIPEALPDHDRIVTEKRVATGAYFDAIIVTVTY
jgi:spore coat protein U-like protein